MAPIARDGRRTAHPRGFRAVIAKLRAHPSFEPRGMGVLPLQFPDGEPPQPGLDGPKLFDRASPTSNRAACGHITPPTSKARLIVRCRIEPITS